MLTELLPLTVYSFPLMMVGFDKDSVDRVASLDIVFIPLNDCWFCFVYILRHLGFSIFLYVMFFTLVNVYRAYGLHQVKKCLPTCSFVQIQIILPMRKLSSWPLRSIHTFCSIQ